MSNRPTLRLLLYLLKRPRLGQPHYIVASCAVKQEYCSIALWFKKPENAADMISATAIVVCDILICRKQGECKHLHDSRSVDVS